ncbi:uracil-DNA glycosylase [Candidatus Saccharibacteria bacterium]|nr:uracil-DNA glycosylase [Candidatus Saccharibacteria bacterium]
MTKQQLLDQIKADIIRNNVCPNLAEQATQLVFGDGAPDADIVFIGEAPGRQEDEQGLPFVGASGKFLSEMLASIHLKREQVYITNIVKYRPPQNRDPLPEEKKEFLPYLIKQLEIIKPKLVVTLGRHSGMQFLPDLHISKDHGQPKKISMKYEVKSMKNQGAGSSILHTSNSILTAVILPLYHPAAALYNGSQRQVLMDDFSLIPQILEKLRK